MRGVFEQRDRVAWVLMVAAGSYLLGISILALHWDRWLIPVLTMALILAGIGIDQIMRRFQQKPLVLVVVFVVLFAAPTLRLARTMVSYAQPHTHDLALAWIDENVPSGSAIAAEPYMHIIDDGRFRVERLPNLAWWTPEQYREKGVSYFVLTDNIYSTILEEAKENTDHVGYNHASEVYAELIGQWDLLATFSSHAGFTTEELVMSNDVSVFRTLDPLLRRGATVWIYAWNDPPSP
jgi:hypothetical protein